MIPAWFFFLVLGAVLYLHALGNFERDVWVARSTLFASLACVAARIVQAFIGAHIVAASMRKAFS